MVESILPLFESVFLNCVNWTGKLFDAVGGKGVVAVAFCIVLVVSLLLMPIRGRGIEMSFNDFTKSFNVRVPNFKRSKEKGLVVSDRKTGMRKK